MDQQLPPNNAEAEQAVLGSCLANRDVIALVAGRLAPEDFYQTKHAVIFRAMVWLYKKRTPIDLVTLTDALTTHSKLEEAGGVAFLSSFLIAPWESVHVEYYAEIVSKMASLRRLIATGIEMVKLGYDVEGNVDDAMTKAQHLLNAARGMNVVDRMRVMQAAVVPFAEELEMRWNGTWVEDVMPTGYHEVDKLLGGGFERTEFGIIAARPSIGKTAFALGIAKKVAARQKLLQEDPGQIIFFSSEMSLNSLLWRALSESTGIPVISLKRGTGLSSDQKQRIGDQLVELSELPIMIDDTSAPTTSRMREKVEQVQSRSPVRLVLFDYIEQAGDERKHGESEEGRVSMITRRLNQMAKGTETTVLALSQLSRNVENRENKKPVLADLRYSGMIEQEADVVMMLYRQDYYSGRGMLTEKFIEPDRNGIAEVIIAKNRNGGTGSALLSFAPDITSFRNLTDGPRVLFREGA